MRINNAKTKTTKQAPVLPPEPTEVLTRREIEVMRLLARGLRNKDIGNELFISEGTVKIHLHNIFGKLRMRSRLALGLYAREKRLI